MIVSKELQKLFDIGQVNLHDLYLEMTNDVDFTGHCKESTKFNNIFFELCNTYLTRCYQENYLHDWRSTVNPIALLDFRERQIGNSTYRAHIYAAYDWFSLDIIAANAIDFIHQKLKQYATICYHTVMLEYWKTLLTCVSPSDIRMLPISYITTSLELEANIHKLQDHCNKCEEEMLYILPIENIIWEKYNREHTIDFYNVEVIRYLNMQDKRVLSEFNNGNMLLTSFFIRKQDVLYIEFGCLDGIDVPRICSSNSKLCDQHKNMSFSVAMRFGFGIPNKVKIIGG